jgi:CBS domain containing-hemolysin-like protein
MVFVRSAEDKRVLGILTLEDVLEELVGDIYDESDQVLGDGEEVKV